MEEAAEGKVVMNLTGSTALRKDFLKLLCTALLSQFRRQSLFLLWSSPLPSCFALITCGSEKIFQKHKPPLVSRATSTSNFGPSHLSSSNRKCTVSITFLLHPFLHPSAATAEQSLAHHVKVGRLHVDTSECCFWSTFILQTPCSQEHI